MSKKGLLIVISGPSGVGKSTVLDEVIKRSPFDLYFSVSATTRKPRSEEQDSLHYYFVSRDKFQKMIDSNELLEWAEFAGHFYGTPAAPVDEAFAKGKCVLLDIEVQGAMQVKEARPHTILVFIAPPDMKTLEARLRHRQTDPEEKVQLRLEIARQEYLKSHLYDHVVVNDDLETAVSEIEGIINSYMLKD